MSYEDTSRSLARLKNEQDVSFNDVFNLFKDLCTDTEKKMGGKLDTLSQNVEEEDIVPVLLWVGNRFQRVITKNPQLFQNPANISALQGTTGKIAKSIELLEERKHAIEVQIDEKRDLLNRQELLNHELTLREENLKETEANLADTQKKGDLLQKECDRLEAEIAGIRTVDIPGLQSQKRNLEKQKSQAAEEKLKVEKDIASVNSDIERERQEKSKHEQALMLRRKIYEGVKADSAALKADLDHVKADVKEIDDEIRKAKVDLEIEKNNISRLEDTKKVILTQITNLIQDQNDLDMQTLQKRLDEETVNYSNKKQEYDSRCQEIDVKIRNMQDEYAGWKKDLQVKEEHELEEIERIKALYQKEEDDLQQKVDNARALAEKDHVDQVNRIKAEEDALVREKEAMIQKIQTEEQASKRRINEYQTRIDEERGKQEQLNQDLAEKEKQLENEKNDTVQAEESCKKEIEKLRAVCAEAADNLTAARVEKERLEQILCGAEARASKEELDHLNSVIEIYQTALDSLNDSFLNARVMDGDSAQKNAYFSALNRFGEKDYFAYFERTLKSIHEELNAYVNNYQIVLNALMGGK